MQPSQLRATNGNAPAAGANPGYALGQIARALAISESHDDPDVRARAERKVEIWTSVFQGMLSGALQVGSRVPVAGTPAWATLEVVQGGFATGRLLAGGDLQSHERELLARLPSVPSGSERAALNAYYLSDDGLAELGRLLTNGCYRLHLPEEGALLVVAWLVQHGHADEARTLLDTIGGHFSQLRFYPVPDPRPLTATATVHLHDVGTTIADLEAIKPCPLLAMQKEAVEVWTPLYDRVGALFTETVQGSIPTLRVGGDGKPLRGDTGQFQIEGGWPCQNYPDGWKGRARAVLADYLRLRREHRLCAAPDSEKGGFPTLRRYLLRCIDAPTKLTGRDVGTIRSILAGIATSRGLPGSSRREALRAHQARQVAGPTRTDLARALVERLSGLPRHEGLASLDEVVVPLTVEEAERLRVPPGKAMPRGLVAKVRRCLDAPVHALVEQGVIPSAEVLARVVPQITSQVRAAAIPDPELRRLYGAIYSAFRRRRSLLLLNLESQVKLEELPWVRAIAPYRENSLDARQQSRQALEELVVLALTAFPQQIFPNKFLQEVSALAEGAGLRLPIVEEVAADIFMGTFTEKFLLAAQEAAEMLEGTLYERYYGLPYAAVRRMSASKSWWGWGKATAATFAKACAELAGESGSRWSWSVARNGKIIEQEQILTTHNLAVLFDALGLRETLRPRLEELAMRCYHWSCQRLQQRSGDYKADLQAIKNAAYAWRQMLFFLTVAPEGAVETFLSRATGHLREQPPAFQARFRPALAGLVRAAKGLPVEAPASPVEPGGARRFLGWTTERHWLNQPE